MKLPSDEQAQAVSQMRKEWESRAKENPCYYIMSSNKRWTLEEFMRTGELDVATLVDPFLARSGLNPAGKSVLEIGCGIGRMSCALAKRFGSVFGTDISAEMLAGASRTKAVVGITNAHFALGSGKDLAQYRDEAFDFVFSYIVFQHITELQVILSYVSEIARVLKPGGFFLFQVLGFRHIRIGKSRVAYWGLRQTGWLWRFGIKHRPYLYFGKRQSWAGVPVRASDIQRECERTGLRCTDVRGIGKQYMWFEGQKASREC